MYIIIDSDAWETYASMNIIALLPSKSIRTANRIFKQVTNTYKKEQRPLDKSIKLTLGEINGFVSYDGENSIYHKMRKIDVVKINN